ncbi:MAG: hypothetical protein E7680_02795 [Ruminococcaceae bacterium]|nr:hypothetical protein [Oscillospiraceae bacterium]
MVDFILSAHLVNALFTAGGIGICSLCFMHITSSVHLRKEVRRYFQFFFLLILFYISTHLARELLNGRAGEGARIALYIITFAEFLSAGFMAHTMSILVLAVAQLKKKATIRAAILLYAFLFIHIVILIACAPNGLIYQFNDENRYVAGKLIFLSYVCPVNMLITDAVLLFMGRKKIDKRVNSAFWIYLISPIPAIILQTLGKGKFQFLIFATVLSSVYMFSVIIQNQNDKYAKQQLETSRIENELNMASSIQSSMLPNIFPPFPERSEFDIFASMNPAKEVGGDFYDFFLVDDDHLCMVMADVSGKGVPAALFMMASKIILANNAMMGKSPAQILTDTNAAICSNNREEMFVTVWIGILEISTGKLTAANAGHEYPVLKQANGNFELVKDKHGFVIGGMDGVKYKEYELRLEPGAKLLLYTDGVPEATNAQNELFGADRMLAALNQNCEASPADTLNHLRSSVDAFVKDAEQFDDLTMLCLEYKGKQ